MKKNNIIGKTFKNNAGLEFEVIKKVERIKTETYYKIKFLKSGSVKKAEKRNIVNGRVRDDFDKHIYGVACKGNASTVKPLINKIAFKRWYAMIERCYCKDSISYKSYGDKGVFVNERWLCFENFIYDLKNIKGFDYNKYIAGEIQLDKDLIENGNKEYSLEKCMFIDTFKNKSYEPTKRKEFIAISPEGKEFIFNNQNECARTFNLTARTISKVLTGQLKSHKGWTFKYK